MSKLTTFVSGLVIGIGVTLGGNNIPLAESPSQLSQAPKNVAVDNAGGGNQKDEFPSDVLEERPYQADTFPDVLEEKPAPAPKRGIDTAQSSKEDQKPKPIYFKERKTDYQRLAQTTGTNYKNILTRTEKEDLTETKNRFSEILDQMVQNDILSNTFIVEKDRWLSHYAKEQGTTYEKLAELNGISDPNSIYEGEVLLTAGCCPGLSEDETPRQPKQRWYLIGSRPTKEKVENIMPSLDVPSDVKSGWKTAIETGQGFQVEIPRGIRLEQLTYGLKDGSTGQAQGVFTLWTHKNGDTWEEGSPEVATVWLTSMDSQVTYALALFEKCKNVAWFTIGGHQPPEPDINPIPVSDKTCPECQNKIIEVEVRVPYLVEEQVVPEKVEKQFIRPIAAITTSSGTGNISNLTVAGSNVFAGLRFQKNWRRLRSVLDAGIAYDIASGFTLLEGSSGTFHLTLRPELSAFGFTVADHANFRPQKGDIDSNSIIASWARNLGPIWPQVGYGYTQFFANERRPESYYTNVWGKLGVNILGNTGKVGLFFDAASKFENAEWGANWFMWKKFVPGAFVELVGRNMGLVLTYSRVEEHSYDKVERVEGFDTVDRFGAHFYWLPDWKF